MADGGIGGGGGIKRVSIGETADQPLAVQSAGYRLQTLVVWRQRAQLHNCYKEDGYEQSHPEHDESSDRYQFFKTPNQQALDRLVGRLPRLNGVGGGGENPPPPLLFSFLV